MSWGEGEYYNEWATPDHEFFCCNCGQQIYYPYVWRNIDKSEELTEEWKIIKKKVYMQINETGKHIRLCECCDKFYTSEQLIKSFLRKRYGIRTRAKEKLKKWNDIEESKRQKAVKKFGRKVMVYELCPDCGGTGFIQPGPDEYRKSCDNCLNGEITKLISF
ncbi:hypothetical protein LCGC14_1827060 [marine sediment metagenome]|uniref:Uncharacterized protein n=1 Tax=marine sediment metagenome TaxID=412755 RepID=A0A0F9IWS5_9ZZZZ